MEASAIQEAVAKMIERCDLLMDVAKVTGGYPMRSASGVLRELGYTSEEAFEVIQAIAEHGFNYCLDHRISCSDGVDGDNRHEYPDPVVCVWGADQLASRLYGFRLSSVRV